MPDGEALARLEQDGLVLRDGGAARTTRKWHAAMSRAAFCLARGGEDLNDLRMPIAVAMLETYAALPDDRLADLVEAMLAIERDELARVLVS